MKKINIAILTMALAASFVFASTQNIATISDLKETIQILLKYKKQAEERLLVLEKRLGITNAYQTNANGIADDIAIDAKSATGNGNATQSEIDELKEQILQLQSAIKLIDPNALLDGSDDLLSKTYVTQREFEEFKKFVLGEIEEIKKTNDRINQLLQGGGIGNSLGSELWERVKKIEQALKNCNCGLPESEIK